MNRCTLSFIFGLGIVAQSLLLLRGLPISEAVKGIVVAALFGLVGIMPGRHEHHYELHFHIGYCFVIYIFGLVARFKKELMAQVSESSLLSCSLVFWYLYASHFNGSKSQIIWMVIAVLPTLLTLLVAFTQHDWTYPVRLACYFGFLFLVVGIMIFQVHFGNMAFLFSDHYQEPSLLNLFITGMAFAYLATAIFYVHLLIPFKQKHQSWDACKKNWRRDLHLMASHFLDYQMTPRDAIGIIGVQGGFYALNYIFHWMPDSLAVNMTLVFTPSILKLIHDIGGRPDGTGRDLSEV